MDLEKGSGKSSVLALPHRFGRYRLTNLLAVGGMAQIYLAKSYGAEGFVKPLVIKRLDPRLAGDERFTRLFIDEAKMLVSLNHGNIVPVFDFGRVGDELYMAMEHIRGASLRDLLRALSESHRTLDFQVAAYIAAEICKGLDYAHRKSDELGRPSGIIHRDIKPTNILISLDGEVKIVDFGVAKLAHRPDEGELSGTVAYMSPEQANRRAVDSRTDIFSAGLTLHEMLTLRQAYNTPDGSASSLLQAARHAQLPPLDPRIPTELRVIVETATQRDPKRRYAAAHDMEHALTEFLVLSRSVGSAIDSEPLASKISSLLREFPALGRGEQNSSEIVPPASERSADGPGTANVPVTEHHDETSLLFTLTSAAPPDLALIHNAADTFHSEFLSRVELGGGSGQEGIEHTADLPLPARPRFFSAWHYLALGIGLLAVFGAGLASALLLRDNDRLPPLSRSGLPVPPPRHTGLDARTRAEDGATQPPPASARSQRRPSDAGLLDAAAGAAPAVTPLPRRPIRRPAKPIRRPAKRYGALNLSSIPWSRVTIDGQRISRPTPLWGLRLAAGTHTVVLENRSRKLRRVLRLRIRAGQTVSQVVRLDKP